jgi:sigma-B regulation protein RsbU (phosphoserine phosphatase)
VRGDGSLLRLSDGGPAMARLLKDADYTTGEVGLDPGNRIVLFTDGVTEAADADGEMYGDERLEELIRGQHRSSAAELEQTVAATVLEHADGTLQDDLTLVVVAVL